MTETERLDLVTRALHADGRRETLRQSYAVGSTLRHAANTIRAEFGLPALDYDGETIDEANP